MQTANVQELKELLLKTDEEFRQLATQHHELDDRLHELSGKALPVRTRASRRSHSQETQAPAEGQDGRYPAPASQRAIRSVYGGAAISH